MSILLCRTLTISYLKNKCHSDHVEKLKILHGVYTELVEVFRMTTVAKRATKQTLEDSMSYPTEEWNDLCYRIGILEENTFIGCCIIVIAFIACVVMQVAFGLTKGYGYPFGAMIFYFYVIMDARQDLKRLYLQKKQMHDSYNQERRPDGND